MLKEQHRPDGTLPSEDRWNRRNPNFQPTLRCEDCIDKNLRAEALARKEKLRLQARYGRVML